MENEALCDHLQNVSEIIPPKDYVCEECIKAGGSWVHLRTCQTCGITLCCDSSPKKHMTAHYHATGHPVISSAEPGEQWLWCYKDDAFAEY
ncbi:UBP-type zinc finger domain-containing protein [Mucilaginibacter sp. UR6-11]|uniref:UBP-type zinc finger domain-containing protein n=1 Tax=Mucilaginibacter sp. UR6-11 TaxID=1435644 RepID=UPI001E62E7FF|nr:UBP-type zinc finger domain-containing protein [Mucilaginibacter sp. UR6-11]MCC8425577.1 UBP-type zinc finger domain-containing protein [Mucilaginibacter sp. UR6-11]